MHERNCDPAGPAAGPARAGQRASAERLEQQVRFLLELDLAKTVTRQSYLTDGSRRENDAEHMWHAAVAALVLAEHSAEPLDAARVIAMLLLHDVVEIDAGDTFVYDADALSDKSERETAAASRLFGLLPPDQEQHFRELWDEFEARSTAEARLAAAIDRLLPLLLNRASGGRSWREHGIRSSQVLHVNSVVDEASDILGDMVRSIVSEAVRAGMLGPE
ncbi:MAG: HD domain-containing protein [Actinomycetota bacterium]|nr:HD domain-containing protein [Actinomycetota bacterium]